MVQYFEILHHNCDFMSGRYSWEDSICPRSEAPDATMLDKQKRFEKDKRPGADGYKVNPKPNQPTRTTKTH